MKLNEFINTDGTLRAVSHVDHELISVNYYQHNQLIATVEYPDKSIRWVTDCMENYVDGILTVEMLQRQIKDSK